MSGISPIVLLARPAFGQFRATEATRMMLANVLLVCQEKLDVQLRSQPKKAAPKPAQSSQVYTKDTINRYITRQLPFHVP